MSDLPPQPFLMHGARDAMAAGLAHIEAQVKSVEQAVVENPGLAFDLATTLVDYLAEFDGGAPGGAGSAEEGA